eukprot:7364041-Heterocapsa_arctica.AAC.1
MWCRWEEPTQRYIQGCRDLQHRWGVDFAMEVRGDPLSGDLRRGFALVAPMRLVLLVEGNGLLEAKPENVAERASLSGRGD